MQLADGYTDLPPGKLANVVTCLEMFEPPERREGNASCAFVLDRIGAAQVDRYRTLFRRIGTPYLWFSRLALDDAALRAVLADPRVEAYALRSHESDEGMLEIDFRADAEAEIVFFGVSERLVGTGAGRWLMNRALDLAWAHPIRRLWLHTCSFDHPSAVPFYMRSGFRPFKRQIEYYDDPRLTGLLPRDAAPNIPLI